jgi:16S rRNA (guanine(966)-N(2))-methyltransferase RsmD
MRIIAGELGGRRIEAPPGRDTRPMLDRVREALFSTLLADVPGAAVLDLFAGTGSLGLEALSRGAASARLVESDPRALKRLRANVAALELGARAEVVPSDALAAASWGATPVDVVLLDPPYPLVRDPRALKRLHAAIEQLVAGPLDPDGVIVLHAPRGTLRETSFPAGLAARERVYGTNALWYLRPEAAS